MTLSIEGSDEFVASSAASIATGQATLPRRDFHPLKHTCLHGAPTAFDSAHEPPRKQWFIHARAVAQRIACCALCAEKGPHRSRLAINGYDAVPDVA